LCELGILLVAGEQTAGELGAQLCTTYISCEVEEFAVLVEPGGPLPGNDLEEQDAEAEHVGFDGEEALGSVLRRDVTTGGSQEVQKL